MYKNAFAKMKGLKLFLENIVLRDDTEEKNSKFKLIFLQDLYYFGNPNKGILKTL